MAMSANLLVMASNQISGKKGHARPTRIHVSEIERDCDLDGRLVRERSRGCTLGLTRTNPQGA